MTQKHFGSAKCAAEILMQASTRLGKPMYMGFGTYKPMALQDAIADVSTNNAQGALDAFKAMHEATGADDLIEWQKDRANVEIAVLMRETARKITQ